MTTILNISEISKQFTTNTGQIVQALDALSLYIEENEFVCIVGPSGCGKSTLLRILAGLETQDSGLLHYYDQEIIKPRAEIGMVFQEYSLLPWRNVSDNVSLGQEFLGANKAKCQQVAMQYLELVGLQSFAKAMPHELSGGMRQRVAIARALANCPQVLLMDEPFGALDAHTRILLQRELLRIRKKHKTTVVFVTHSVDEAIYLADRIIVMSARPGKILQILPIELTHPRERSHPRFAELTETILNMLDASTIR